MLDDGEQDSHSLDSEKPLLTQSEPVNSANLPKNVSLQLWHLMNEITKSEITPATVNAACNCASSIHKFLKLNLELKRN